ncbi:MAG: hypothetical protein HYR49_05325 [Gammaproteobacteria bacterium]|nr:hypothetical protein [Gammaproteobacteria bacterium]
MGANRERVDLALVATTLRRLEQALGRSDLVRELERMDSGRVGKNM